MFFAFFLDLSWEVAGWISLCGGSLGEGRRGRHCDLYRENLDGVQRNRAFESLEYEAVEAASKDREIALARECG